MMRTKLILILSAFLSLSAAGYPPGEDKPGMEVKGHVYEASTGKPIDGISVYVGGFSSAITGKDGSFTMRVPNGSAVLQIGGLNFQSTEMPVKGQKELSVYLYEAGYANFFRDIDMAFTSAKPAYSTQSIALAEMSETGWRFPSISPEKSFEGRISGLNVIPRSGNPGIGSDMFLRGFTSLYLTNQPLIIVDGMIYDNGSYGTSAISGYRTNPLADMATENLESVSVIRDAASIYGSRAANGVIFIRTTHAYEYATKIELSAYGGINLVPEEIPLLNAGQYRVYLNELLLSGGLTPDSIARLPYMSDDETNAGYYRFHNDEVWQKKVFKESFNQNYNLKITGGDDIAMYSLSVGYLVHDGIVKNTGFSRLNMRFNSDINITKKLKLNANIGVTNAQRDLMPDGLNLKTNPYLLSLRKAPFLYDYVRSSTGIVTPNFEDADVFGVSNPAALLDKMTASNRNYRISGSFNVAYRIGNSLTISNLIGVNYGKNRDNLFVPHLGVADENLPVGVAMNEMGHRVERLFGLNNDFNVGYQKRFNDSHSLSANGGLRLGVYKTQEDRGTGYNSPNDEMRSVGTGNILMRRIGGYIGNWNWMTFYATAGYDYLTRYFLSVSASLDGSSRFGDEAKGIRLFSNSFGFFPSVSAGWLISSEHFMAGVKAIDILKIRIGYGMTGNDDIGNYTAVRYYRPQAFIGAQGLVAGNIGNPGLKWENNAKLNAGIDIAAFRERMHLSFDVFRNRTTDMISYVPLGKASGFSFYIENDGSFNTTGFDFSVNARLINRKVKWDLGLNLAHYKTGVTSIAGDQVINTVAGATVLTRVGQPLNLFYGYKTNGVYVSASEASAAGMSALIDNTVLLPFGAGDVRFEETDGNKIIDENDRQIIGDPNPDLTGMVTTMLNWKGITLDAGMSFSLGNEVYNQTLNMLGSVKNYDNQSLAVLNRWRYDGQVTLFPRASWNDPVGNSRFSDRWIEDGSFVRLKYVTLCYKLPLGKKLLNKAEIFTTGQNLLTFTRYKGADPEFSLSDASYARGIDIGLTPQPRAVFFGIRLGL